MMGNGGFAFTALLGLLVLSVPVYGTATLKLSDGQTSLTIWDGEWQDANPLDGEVSYLGTIGSWTVNVRSAATSSSLSLSLVDVMSRAGGSLLVEFGQTDFTGVHPHWGMLLGGTLQTPTYATAEYWALHSDTDLLFGG